MNGVKQEGQEVFRGHLEECLQHFGNALVARAPKGSKGSAQARQPMADFCGVGISTVARWLYSIGSLPVGEPLIKLMCYLDLVGYRVIELERMPQGKRAFAELVGYGILSGEEAAKLIGYGNASSLYQVFRGMAGTSEDKDQRMWDAWKERRDVLARKKLEAAERCGKQPVSKESIPATVAAPTAARKTAGTRTHHLGVALSMMNGLVELLEDMPPFGELSESDRSSFVSGTETILRLSAHLSALSSQLLTSRGKGG